MDGYLKIKTKIDNKDIDKDIIALENKIKKLQKSNIWTSREQDLLTKEIQQYDNLKQKAEEYKSKIKDLEVQKKNLIKLNPTLVTSKSPELDNLVIKLNRVKEQYSNTTKEIDKQNSKMDKLYFKLDKIKSKQTENNAKIAQYKQQIEQINTNKIEKSLNTVGKNLQNQIGKMGKMAMAVVGIRTAWYAVRGAITAVSEYNDQISTDFEYMRYCIANMLAPAVEKLTQLLYTLLSYVNAIANAWFGINLFGNSSVKNFKKMKESATGTAKATKEIVKTLTGFDEMNVVSDNSSSGSTGISTPSMDLSGIQGAVPTWLQWIIDNKDLILATLAGITAGVVALKLGLEGIKALGIGVMVTGLLISIQTLLKYLKDPTWENFGKIISGIGIAILGVAAIAGSTAAAIVGAVVLVAGIIIANWQKIRELFQDVIDWLTQKIEEYPGLINILGNWILSIIKGIVEIIMDIFDGLFNGIKQIIDGIILLFKGDLKGGLTQIVKGIANAIIGIINAVVSAINAIIYPIRQLIVEAGKILGKNWTLSSISIPKIPLLATGGIVNNPGRGVPIGGAIAGEAGAEGVIPLTDSQAMETLGEAIGRYITINANITNSMNGRVISRQLKKIQANKDFAYNT